MNSGKPIPKFWRNTSITTQLGVGLFLLLCFIAVVSITAYLAMYFVRKADESIGISTEIQRLVLEMDRGMEGARLLHSQFFIEYPRIGLKEAHEKYAQPSIRQTAKVVSLSKKLQNTIVTAEVSEALRESKVDISLYLASAKRFADTSIEAVRLATLLAAPERGLTAQLDQSLEKLDSELTKQGLHPELFHVIQGHIYKHRITRERFEMQSAFNASFVLRGAIEQNNTSTVLQKQSLYLLLNEINELSEAILETDVAIKSKFSDFALQKIAADAVSSSLVDLARKEVEESQKKISRTYAFAQVILLVVCSFGLLAACLIVWFLNTKITTRIVRLTRSAEELRKGKLDVAVVDEAEDELGELGRTFNFMAVRIKDLVDNLENQIARQTKSLQLEKEKAQNYLDVAGVMLSVLDSSGKIRLMNQKGCEILQITEQQAIGQDWFEHYLPEEKKEEVRSVFGQLMSGDVRPAEYYENPIITSAGEMRIIAFHNTVLKDSQGNFSGVLFSGEDITERKQHEAEREVLEAQLRQAHKMEAIGTLAGGIAHDFNNILAAMLGFTELAKIDIPEYSPARYQLDEVINAGNRAKDLVKHILSFSRKEPQAREAVEVNFILKEVLQFLRATIPTTIRLDERLASDCGHILAEATQIHQVLVNLCTNAAHAMEDNGGILEISSSRVDISAEELAYATELKAGSYVMIMIRDNGTGIDPHIVDRIFDPYFTTKKVGKGSGMGLAVVAGIVKSSDGAITVESELGKGTTFKVYFPRVELESTIKAVHEEPLPLGKEHILVVDDDPSITRLTQKRLEFLGYQVTAVTSSKECLELFSSTPDVYDMVITDQTMPFMTGDQLARALRQVRTNIPILLCTGYSSKMDDDKARAMEINAFILKPITHKELAKTVRQVFDTL